MNSESTPSVKIKIPNTKWFQICEYSKIQFMFIRHVKGDESGDGYVG